MPVHPNETPGVAPGSVVESRYQPPTFELICLACEISAYAPDGDLPLF